MPYCDPRRPNCPRGKSEVDGMGSGWLPLQRLWRHECRSVVCQRLFAVFPSLNQINRIKNLCYFLLLHTNKLANHWSVNRIKLCSSFWGRLVMAVPLGHSKQWLNLHTSDSVCPPEFSLNTSCVTFSLVFLSKIYPVLFLKSASLFIYNISCVCVMSHVFLPACIHNTATRCLCSQQCRWLSHPSPVNLLASWHGRPTPPHTLCILSNVGSNTSRTASSKTLKPLISR